MNRTPKLGKWVWDDIPALKIGGLLLWFMFMNTGIPKVFPQIDTIYVMLITEILLALGLVEFGMSRIKRRFFFQKYSLRNYGRITVASTSALLILGLSIFGVLVLRHFGVVLQGSGVSFTLDWSVKGIASGLLVCLVAPVYEEILFRYVVQHCIFRNYVGWIQILVPALIFGLAHGTGYHAVFGTLFGIVSGYVFLVEQDLWISILIHIFVNTMTVFPFMIPVVALLMVVGFIRIVYLKYKLVKRAKENPEIVKIEIEINESDSE